jgi:hypothetical protein
MIASFVIVASLLLRNVFNCDGHLLADLFPVKNTMFSMARSKTVCMRFKEVMLQ